MATSDAPGLALFDLDGTLLPIDSDHAWGEFMVASGWVDAAAFQRGNDAFYAQYRAGTLDIHAYIAFACAPLRTQGAAARAAARERFVREVIAPARSTSTPTSRSPARRCARRGRPPVPRRASASCAR